MVPENIEDLLEALELLYKVDVPALGTPQTIEAQRCLESAIQMVEAAIVIENGKND